MRLLTLQNIQIHIQFCIQPSIHPHSIYSHHHNLQSTITFHLHNKVNNLDCNNTLHQSNNSCIHQKVLNSHHHIIRIYCQSLHFHRRFSKRKGSFHHKHKVGSQRYNLNSRLYQLNSHRRKTPQG